jgi:hypothetical protein
MSSPGRLTCHPPELWTPWHLLQPTKRIRAALQHCGPARRRHAILLSHSALLLGVESHSAFGAGNSPMSLSPILEATQHGLLAYLGGYGLGVKPSGPWRYATVRPLTRG